ncbi:MAG: AraC family transcriptional regulator [Pseudomonadales bacterium]|nr:AraC family transcriptional regulator [Pseudomonadales bacterium]
MAPDLLTNSAPPFYFSLVAWVCTLARMFKLFNSNPLQRYQLHKTRDIEAVHACVAEILCPHKVAASALGALSDDALVHSAPLPNGAIMFLRYGAEIRIDVSQLGFFLLEFPLTGASTTYCGKGNVLSEPGQAVVAGPYQQFATEWTADCSKLLIKIENSALENYLSTLLGRRQIRALDFEMRIDLAAGSSSSLLRVVRWILEEMDQPDSLFNSAPLAGQQCQRMLMWALLYSQPNNYSEELAARQLVQIPHYVLQTEQYIHEHYTEAMSLEQLVEQSNVSERTLLEGFKRFHDVSPMKLLKLTRLDYVHLALKEADPATSNVTDIAMAAGFSQLGKFSAEYKERFGVSPSETLKG